MKRIKGILLAASFFLLAIQIVPIEAHKSPPPITYPEEIFRRVELPENSPSLVKDSLVINKPAKVLKRVVLVPKPVIHSVTRVKKTIKKPPQRRFTGRSIRGLASYYCRSGISICTSGYPDNSLINHYAAAGPKLRSAICGSSTSNCWRGKTVYVDGVAVRLIDWCQCYKGRSYEKLLDLYWDMFKIVGGNVVIHW